MIILEGQNTDFASPCLFPVAPLKTITSLYKFEATQTENISMPVFQ